MTYVDVIDDFLPEYQFKQLKNIMMGTNFAWFYSEGVNVPYHKTQWQLCHLFYYDGEKGPDGGPLKSNYLPLMDPLVDKLGIKNLCRIKANLQTRTIFHRKDEYHVDYNCSEKDLMMTAVYYLNTNNGWTEFKNGGKVKSVANRMIMFDTTLSHRGVSCTDEKRRMVVNFNWE